MDATEPKSEWSAKPTGSPSDSWPPMGWNTAPLLPTFSSTNPCNKSPGKFAHPFDRCLYRGIILTNTKVVGNEHVGSDHYGLLTTFQIGNMVPIRAPIPIYVPPLIPSAVTMPCIKNIPPKNPF